MYSLRQEEKSLSQHSLVNFADESSLHSKSWICKRLPNVVLDLLCPNSSLSFFQVVRNQLLSSLRSINSNHHTFSIFVSSPKFQISVNSSWFTSDRVGVQWTLPPLCAPSISSSYGSSALWVRSQAWQQSDGSVQRFAPFLWSSVGRTRRNRVSPSSWLLYRRVLVQHLQQTRQVLTITWLCWKRSCSSRQRKVGSRFEVQSGYFWNNCAAERSSRWV